MPFASNRGVKIHYEVEGKGSPLVLQHGFTGNIQEWRDLGYVEALKSSHKLILIDARGHGGSDKPVGSDDYSGKLMAEDVVAVLDDAQVKAAAYLGYSMGGWIGYNLIRYHTDRFTHFIIGGMTPYPFKIEKMQIGMFLRGLLQAGLEGGSKASIDWVENLEGAPMAEYRRKGYYEMNFPSLSSLFEAMVRGFAAGTPLNPTKTPCLIFAGELDEFHAGAKRASQELPNAKFISLSGIDHIQAFSEVDTVVANATRLFNGKG
ncbi:alpha/beta hydrolase [Candidatus Bathyarchaeota archaeon]|nr:alpha/beta hydrolase [Candidatus Bathyarchaeota archaeon]